MQHKFEKSLIGSERSARVLLERAVEAHGGWEAWRRVETLGAEIRFGGLAFALRLNPTGRRRRRVEISTRHPRVVFHDYPRPGRRGVFAGHSVRLESVEVDGSVIDDSPGRISSERVSSSREHPRAAMRSPRRYLWWDALDLLYFAGYALWNYLCAPFLFARPGFVLREIRPLRGSQGGGRRIEVFFPDRIPTHSRRQISHFGVDGRLRRIDYVAEPFASWARASNVCLEFREVAGLVVGTRRRVTPWRADGSRCRGPILVWIELENLVASGEAIENVSSAPT